MINACPPHNWADLQIQTARILEESGLQVEIEKSIKTVRDSVCVDVFAVDDEQQPPLIYIFECKKWSAKVPKTIVHALRTVVSDYGANWGIVISSAGYQKGAIQAAQNTNLKLLTWADFETMFEERWVKNYFGPRMCQEAEALCVYTEPLELNPDISDRVASLGAEQQQQFYCLQHQYLAVASLSVAYATPISAIFCGQWVKPTGIPRLPLRENSLEPQVSLRCAFPEELLDVVSLRQFLECWSSVVSRGTAEFESLLSND